MLTKITLSLAIALLLALATAGSAQAAPLITNTNDSGPGSLRQAIAEGIPNEAITVPAGNYQVSSEPLKIEKSVTLVGHGAGDTIIRSVGPFRVFTITPEDAFKSASLSGMTVRDGRVFDIPGLGGGILVGGGRLNLRDVVVTGNIVNVNGESPKAPGGPGGGGGIALLSSSLTMVESTVTGNVVESLGGAGGPGGTAQGGGIATTPESSLTIERSTVSGNVVKANGGEGPSDPGQVGGVALGGGISGNVRGGTVATSTISGNVVEAAPGRGAASGEAAGGAAALITTGNPFEFTNSTIAENVVRNGVGEKPAFGGGIFAASQQSGASITFTSATIAANKLESSAPGSQGGNLVLVGGSATAAFRNTIVSAGVGPTGTENCGFANEPSPVASQGFNLESADQCGFKATGDQVNKDPLLLPLQDFGGPTQTMAPTSRSPIIDQGTAFGLASDQHGAPRPIDLPQVPNSTAAGADGSDIGAYELQPPSGLTLGKLKKNKKTGTATLIVTLPLPSAGTLTLKGKGLKSQKAAIKGQTSLKLKVLATGGAKKSLLKKGKRKVQIKVTYAPTGNAPATKTRKAKLVKKLRKQEKKHP